MGIIVAEANCGEMGIRRMTIDLLDGTVMVRRVLMHAEGIATDVTHYMRGSPFLKRIIDEAIAEALAKKAAAEANEEENEPCVA